MTMNEGVDPNMVGREYRDCAKGAHMTPAPAEADHECELECIHCGELETEHTLRIVGRNEYLCPGQLGDIDTFLAIDSEEDPL